MKKIKIKILYAIIMLVSVAPILCMFRRAATSWRPATSGMSREAAARLVTAQKAERLSAQQSNALPVRDTSTWSGWFQSGMDRLFQRSQQKPEIVSVSSTVSASSPFGRAGQKRMYSTMPVPSAGESKVKVSQNELIESASRAYVVPATSKPGWFSGQAAQQAYDYFLETMNTLKSGKDIGFSRMIILVQYIQQSNYNPINIPDEAGHSFYYYLLKNFKDYNRDASHVNAIRQDIGHCKSLGAELNQFDRQQMSKNIQNDLDRLTTAIRDEDLASIYDIACGFQVYDFAGLDNISATINKDSMNEYIAECRKDPSLFKKLIEYENIVKSYQIDPQLYQQPERYYQSIVDKILEDYNKYRTFLPMYSFDKTFDMDKPFRMGVKLWRGEGTVIKSKKTIKEMVSQGELLDFIQKDVLENQIVQQAITNYKWWFFSRQEARVMDQKTKDEDSFYGKGHETYGHDNKGRVIRIIDFPEYTELKELLKQDIQNKIAHLQRLHDDFMTLAKSMHSDNPLMRTFDVMYKDLIRSDDTYIPNEQVFRKLMEQYHPDKLKSKVEANEISEEDKKIIEAKIAKLTGLRTTYQKEQLAKE